MARKPQKFKMSRDQQKIAADNLNLARDLAWKTHWQTGIEYQILESVAFEGLCKASYRYNPEMINEKTGKPMMLSSLAVPTIRGELLHYIRDKTYAVRLSHKMRERWVKGRKLLYRGATDLEIAKELGITRQEWQEVRKVCSGPPLELKEQAKPTEALEPSEINFGGMYVSMAQEAMLSVDHSEVINAMEVYLAGTGARVPREAVDTLLKAAGCHATNWSQEEIDILEGYEDLGGNRVQGSLF